MINAQNFMEPTKIFRKLKLKKNIKFKFEYYKKFLNEYNVPHAVICSHVIPVYYYILKEFNKVDE